LRVNNSNIYKWATTNSNYRGGSSDGLKMVNNSRTSSVKRFLGRRKFNKLVYKTLAKRFVLRELGRKSRRFEDISGLLLNKNFDVQEETVDLGRGYRKGRININIPEKHFAISSFYHRVYPDKDKSKTKRKKLELKKNYDISNYLNKKGIRVPEIVYKNWDSTLAVTDCVPGDVLSNTLIKRNGKRDEKLERITDIVLGQVFRYHKLDDIPQKVQDHLTVEKMSDFYGLNHFVKALGKDPEEYKHLKHERLDELVADQSGLLHNDMHSGNVIANGQDLNIIDWGDATLGAVHFDVCRYLTSIGFYDKVREEEDKLVAKGQSEKAGKVLEKKLNVVLADKLKEHGYNHKEFYSKLNLANALTRLRFAGLTYEKYLKRMEEDQVFAEKLTADEKDLIKDIVSYRYTAAADALEKEGMHDITHSLDELVEHSGIERKDRQWMSDCYAKHNPDVSSWQQMKTIKDKLIDLEEQEDKLDQFDKKVARRRIFKTALGGVAATLAVAALSYAGYQKYITPINERLETEAQLAEHFAEHWQPDIAEKSLAVLNVSYEFTDDEGKVHELEHNIYKLIPAVLNYLYHPSDKEQFKKLFEEFKKDNPDRQIAYDLDKCIKSDDKLSSCYIHTNLKEKEYEKEKARVKEKITGTECIQERTVFSELFGSSRYYPSKDLVSYVDNLDFVYFTLPGVLRSLSIVDEEGFEKLLDEASSGRKLEDPRFKGQLLAENLADLIKTNGNIASAYVDLWCSPDDIMLAGNNKEKILLGEYEGIPSIEKCSQQARDSYFTLMSVLGMDVDTLDKIKTFRLGRKTEEMLLSKSVMEKIKHSSFNKRNAMLNLLYMQWSITAATGDYYHMRLAGTRNAIHLGEIYKNDRAEQNRIHHYDGIGTCSFPFEPIIRKSHRFEEDVHDIVSYVMRSDSMNKSSEQMRKALRCNFSNAISANRINDEFYNSAFLEMRMTNKDSLELYEDKKALFVDVNPYNKLKKTDLEDPEVMVDNLGACLESLWKMHQYYYDKGVLSEDRYLVFRDAADNFFRSWQFQQEQWAPCVGNTARCVIVSSEKLAAYQETLNEIRDRNHALFDRYDQIYGDVKDRIDEHLKNDK